MKPNVLFINLPYLPKEFLWGNIEGKSRMQGSPLTMPMGLLYLSACLKAHVEVGNVALLDYRLHVARRLEYDSDDEFFREEAKRNVAFVPDVIGISIDFSTSSGHFEIVVPQLKILWPKTMLVTGGYHATNATAFLLNCSDVDYVVRGEGEIAFSEIVSQFSRSKYLNIQGVYDRGALKVAEKFLLAEPVANLNVMPLPDWTLLDMERYVTGGRRRLYGEEESIPRAATMLTTRGCPYRCTFCSNHTVHGRRVRSRSADSIVNEMKTLYERYGVTTFIPEDDLFTADKERLMSVLEAIRQAHIPGMDLQLGNGLSVGALDEEMLDALVSVGIRSVTIAIESGSEYVQKEIIMKNVNLKKTKEVVIWSHNRGLIVRAYIIFGFPNETRELMNETVQYMKELGADWYVINIAQPLLGTEMYETFLKRGCFKEGVEFWSHNLSHERRFDTDEISASELTEFCYCTNLEINFLGNVNLRNGNFNRAIELFTDMTQLYPFHIFAWFGLYCAYRGLKNFDKADASLLRMKQLIASDDRAAEMYHQYGHLIEKGIV